MTGAFKSTADAACAPAAGEGKVHSCLRTNFAQLSDACRKEELKLMIMESSNTELMPNLARACKVCAHLCCCCEVCQPLFAILQHEVLAGLVAPCMLMMPSGMQHACMSDASFIHTGLGTVLLCQAAQQTAQPECEA